MSVTKLTVQFDLSLSGVKELRACPLQLEALYAAVKSQIGYRHELEATWSRQPFGNATGLRPRTIKQFLEMMRALAQCDFRNLQFFAVPQRDPHDDPQLSYRELYG